MTVGSSRRARPWARRRLQVRAGHCRAHPTCSRPASQEYSPRVTSARAASNEWPLRLARGRSACHSYTALLRSAPPRRARRRS